MAVEDSLPDGIALGTLSGQSNHRVHILQNLKRLVTFLLLPILLIGCSEPEQTTEGTDTKPEANNEFNSDVLTTSQSGAMSLAAVLAAHPAEVQARYSARNPQQTLEFFGVEPGMTVVEALPGGGWYSKILLSALGSEGHLVGVNYAADLWPLFPNMSEERLAALANWTTSWPADAEEWRDTNSARVSAFVFGELSETQKNTADLVLFIRALHNMARFDERPFLDEAMQNAFDILKPGGIAGVVQHEARADKSDEWANGSRGYLKRDRVIAQMKAIGFTFIGASDINQNPADQPGEADIVWRLPPSLATSGEDQVLKEQMLAIGESNRMTLKFQKPSA